MCCGPGWPAGSAHKAARGELRRGLPVGLVWGEADGEILKHPDKAVSGVIAAIFDRFVGMRPVRGGPGCGCTTRA